MERLLDVLALPAVRGYNAQVVGCGECRCGDVERCGLRVGPDSGTFFAVDILHYFILHVAEDVAAFFVFLGAYLGADFDEKSVDLVLSESVRACG